MRKAKVNILVDGRDIAGTVLPILHDLTVSLKSGGETDKAELTLDDTDGQIAMPRDGAVMTIKIDAVEVFRGKVTEIESNGERSGGRTLSVSADGVNSKGKAKQPQQRHWDNKTLKDILTEAGKDAGISNVKVDNELAGITIEYEAQNGESFMALGQRLAEQVGGTFSISDDRAAMVKRGSGKSASGKSITPVSASWGDNLISWRIAPVTGRPRFKKVRQRYYDAKKAKWVTEAVDVKDDGAEAEHTARFPASDAADAKRKAGSDKTKAEREKGGGTIIIDGNARAFPEAKVTLVGARPGVDGEYTVDSVTHKVGRDGGFATTSLEVKQPAGAAGKDSRKSAAGNKSTGSSTAKAQGAAIGADQFATP